MDNPLTIHGLSMDSSWTWIVNGAAHGLSMDCPWTAFGFPLNSPWVVHGLSTDCMDSPWVVRG
eukprot:7594465-Lingulodinium_polyedra.AAC.1